MLFRSNDYRRWLRAVISPPAGLDTGLRQLCATLTARRDARGVTTDEVARALLLSIRQVHALESGDVSAFHSSWFFERALRRYDALLGCAPDRRQP